MSIKSSVSSMSSMSSVSRSIPLDTLDKVFVCHKNADLEGGLDD